MNSVRSNGGFGLAAFLAALVLLAFAVAGGARAGGNATPTISGASVVLAAVPGRPAAAYATITGGTVADRLLAVEGPGSSRLQLHATTMDDGVMRMSALDAVTVPARSIVAMKPGGMHIMVFGLGGVAPGAEVPLTFVFEKAGRLRVPARAVAANAASAGHNQQH